MNRPIREDAQPIPVRSSIALVCHQLIFRTLVSEHKRRSLVGQYGLGREGSHDDVHRPFGHAGLERLTPHD